MKSVDPQTVQGRISIHPRGFGFLRVAPSRDRATAPSAEASVFVAPPELNGFLAGDLVDGLLVEQEDGRYSARDLSLVERPRNRLFGTVERSGKSTRLQPDAEVANESWPLRGAGDLAVGSWVLAEIDGHSAVRPVEVPPQELSMARILARWSLRGDHDERIRRAAKKSRLRETARLDLRNVHTITIDAPSTRDIDDALSVFPLQKDGSIRVLVSIADVDALVGVDSVVDLEARARGTSVYLPDRVLPMLPEELSEKSLSLLPGEERAALTVEMRIDPEGAVRAVDLQETVIRSDARVSYEQARAFLDEGVEDDLDRECRETLRRLRAAAGRLSAVRSGRGGLTFIREEAHLVFDPATKEPKEIEARVETSAHRLVERLMVAANEAVAGWLHERGLPALYRVHDAPNQDRVQSMAAVASNFGFETAFGGRLTPLSLAAFENQYRSSSSSAAIRTVVQKTLGPARYTVQPAPHFGLGAELYLHFTSPIRRYADLVVHRVIKRHLRGVRNQEAGDPELAALATELNELGFRAAKAEDERLRVLAARLFKKRVGDRISGNVISVKPFGLIVQLAGFGVTGMLPIESLPGEGYRVDSDSLEIVSKDGRHRYAVGAALEVEVRDADEEQGRIELAPIAAPVVDGAASRSRRRTRRRSR